MPLKKSAEWRNMIPCKYCDQPLCGELRPGVLVRCSACNKKNRMPQPREFAEAIFAIEVNSLSEATCDQNALANTIANARLNGARWNRISAQLDSTNLTLPFREEVNEKAKRMIRQGSREDGCGMLLVGLGCTAVCLIATVVQHMLNWNTVYISASLLAIGGVYSLVGALKWATGWSIR